jgi:exopolyphosphatase/guanosine-5'-triphosphate,3'-diphosphate pyrophosphatase
MVTETTHQAPLAAIDIGTNTIRLLVARPVFAAGAIDLEPLATRTATVRLGYGVERTGRLDDERMARAITTVEEFRRIAIEHGAETILLAATSAVRDAANGEDFRAAIAETSGLVLPIISGDREAALTFAGATAGQTLAGTLLVADLGGGSLELIISRDGQILSAESLQLGSGRFTERHIAADPPTPLMVQAAATDAHAILAPHAANAPAVDRLIVVGGTATSVPIIVPRPDERAILTPRRLAGAQAILTGTPVASLAAQTGLDPERVRTLPAGVAIIGALLDSFGVDTALIGNGGIREGLLLDYLRRAEGSAAHAV